jgi:hypothetical protein
MNRIEETDNVACIEWHKIDMKDIDCRKNRIEETDYMKKYWIIKDKQKRYRLQKQTE